jgi:hypothetical protein
VFPVVEYTQVGGHCAVTGGVVYRGSSVFFAGLYLFADYCSDRVWAIVNGEMVDYTNRLGGPAFEGIVAISEDGFGEAYITELNAGRVRRIR